MYLQVMWRFEGQKSFPMSAAAYAEQLDAVAGLLSDWGCVEQAEQGIRSCRDSPQLDTVGAHAIMIPLTGVEL